jgi:hypothetical protein
MSQIINVNYYLKLLLSGEKIVFGLKPFLIMYS